MKVFIHLENLSISYRMQIDGTFLRYEGDLESDFDLMSEDGEDEIVLPNTITLDQITYTIDPDSVSLFDAHKILMKTYKVMIEKGDPVHTPDYNQLKACISGGNDQINNQLVLTVYGDFILTSNFLRSPEYYNAIRFETYIAGNRYVGKEAAEDEKYMKDLYASGLEGYVNFLKTQEVNQLLDDYTNPEQIEESKQVITQILAELD
ncbi:MAG: hypothetical protein AAGU26_05690 [bacterium]